MATAAGRRDWLTDPRLATNQGRVDQRPWLIPEIATILREWPAAELAQTLERLGLPFAPVNRPGDLFDDPHLARSGGFLEIRLLDGRLAKTPALPVSIAPACVASSSRARSSSTVCGTVPWLASPSGTPTSRSSTLLALFSTQITG